ncbi:hypothetical protein [Streptococcus suis]
MKKNIRQALISTLIFIPLFVLFQLWGNLLLRTSLPTTHFSS